MELSRIPESIAPSAIASQAAKTASISSPRSINRRAARRPSSSRLAALTVGALARLPHTYRTRLSALHTVPNGDPPQPFAENTDMCCMLILKPFLFGGDFLTLEATPEKTIQLLSVIPIYPEEMAFKLQHGIYELLPKLQAIGLNERLDLERPNVGL